MVATAIAARGAGARWLVVALLGLATAFVIHPPPIGPVALVCFAAGALLLERARTRSSRMRRAHGSVVDVEVERNTGGRATAEPDFLDADLELKH